MLHKKGYNEERYLHFILLWCAPIFHKENQKGIRVLIKLETTFKNSCTFCYTYWDKKVIQIVRRDS